MNVPIYDLDLLTTSASNLCIFGLGPRKLSRREGEIYITFALQNTLASHSLVHIDLCQVPYNLKSPRGVLVGGFFTL